MAFLEAKTDFDAALLEVDALLDRARSGGIAEVEHTALLKGALLLLCAKVEAFLEETTSEYCFIVGNRCGLTERLPERIRISATLQFLLKPEVLTARLRSAAPEGVTIMKALASLWSANCAVEDLDVGAKFNYGNHGSKEVGRLLEKIDLNDVFETCKISRSTELADGTIETNRLSVRPTFDSITNIRNNILHSDASPSITPEQVADYRSQLLDFAEAIDNRLNEMFEAIGLNGG